MENAVTTMQGDGELSLAQFFSQDHQRCDAAWAQVEEAVDAGDNSAAEKNWQTFTQLMERHLTWEEEVLFPAFERSTGMRGMGPTVVMRAEHEQMRGVIRQMTGLMATGELEEAIDQGDTLLMLIQQHNAKEEGMLYPMAEQHLSSEWDNLRGSLV